MVSLTTIGKAEGAETLEYGRCIIQPPDILEFDISVIVLFNNREDTVCPCRVRFYEWKNLGRDMWYSVRSMAGGGSIELPAQFSVIIVTEEYKLRNSRKKLHKVGPGMSFLPSALNASKELNVA